MLHKNSDKMISIKKITTRKGMYEFVKFPFSLYKNSKTWIPPIIEQEVNFLDPQKNPVFENADAEFFIAYNAKNQAVGRIAVIVNRHEIQVQNIKKVRFGWLDMIDDLEVTRLLLQQALNKAQTLNLNFVEGPMGFSNLDKVGVQTSGFEHIGNMATWTNFPYYAQHLQALGFTKEKGYIETSFLVKNVDSQSVEKMGNLVENRYKLRPISFKKTSEVVPFVHQMFDLFNTTYAPLASFIPITEKQKNFFRDKYLPFIDPELIRFIADEQGNLICFAIVIPSFSKALQRAKGKLFPFGFWHLLQARKNPTEVDFYLIGIAPEYQSKGVPAMLFRDYLTIFKKKGVQKCIVTPELEENIAIQRLWKNFSPIIFGTRATFRKNL